ncbi:hypothetical protein ZEAMMB73_Zm00001d031271 [Zea mays]|uniref:Uncharacterized protein n=1 Tax=Zea mays TaxID=4577 RepID=A0A1D6KHY6_MAIZE|nr:hypothetical protein ZEAMMB73_Zm00001d031271 [Zea mays]
MPSSPWPPAAGAPPPQQRAAQGTVSTVAPERLPVEAKVKTLSSFEPKANFRFVDMLTGETAPPGTGTGTGRDCLLKCSALLYFPVVSSRSMASTVRHGMVDDGALVLLPPAPGVFCSLLLGPCDVSISRRLLTFDSPRVHTYSLS